MTQPIESGEIYQHKWLYTFLPIKTRLYLLAYCPICDKSASSIILTKPTKGVLLTHDMGIPRFGCRNPLSGL